MVGIWMQLIRSGVSEGLCMEKAKGGAEVAFFFCLVHFLRILQRVMHSAPDLFAMASFPCLLPFSEQFSCACTACGWMDTPPSFDS